MRCRSDRRWPRPTKAGRPAPDLGRQPHPPVRIEVLLDYQILIRQILEMALAGGGQP